MCYTFTKSSLIATKRSLTLHVLFADVLQSVSAVLLNAFSQLMNVQVNNMFLKINVIY